MLSVCGSGCVTRGIVRDEGVMCMGVRGGRADWSCGDGW